MILGKLYKKAAQPNDVINFLIPIFEFVDVLGDNLMKTYRSEVESDLKFSLTADEKTEILKKEIHKLKEKFTVNELDNLELNPYTLHQQAEILYELEPEKLSRNYLLLKDKKVSDFKILIESKNPRDRKKLQDHVFGKLAGLWGKDKYRHLQDIVFYSVFRKQLLYVLEESKKLGHNDYRPTNTNKKGDFTSAQISLIIHYLEKAKYIQNEDQIKTDYFKLTISNLGFSTSHNTVIQFYNKIGSGLSLADEGINKYYDPLTIDNLQSITKYLANYPMALNFVNIDLNDLINS